MISGVTAPENATWIGIIAELHKNKGLGYAIEACAKLDRTNHSFFLVIIGEGEERERLESLIRNKGLGNRIILTGPVTNAARLLSAFDIFILPSIKEGLPYSILEAGLAKLSVVASRVGGIPEIIEHNVSGVLTAAKDIDTLKSSLEMLIHDEVLRKSFGEELYKKVTTEFSFKDVLSDTQAVYMAQ